MGSIGSDPQFYIVTGAALGGLWMALRPFLRRSQEQKAGCPTCTTCSVSRHRSPVAPQPPTSGLVTLASGRSDSGRAGSGRS